MFRLNVSDVRNGFDVWGAEGISSDETGENRRVVIATNETVNLYCGAALLYSRAVAWSGVPTDLESKYSRRNSRSLTQIIVAYSIENITSDYSYQSKLIIDGVSKSDEGTFACVAENLTDPANRMKSINVTLKVSDPWIRILNFTNMDENEELYLNLDLALECIVDGLPKPNVAWFKDNIQIWTHDNINLKNDNQILVINRARIEDKGVYRCEASNRAGVEVRSTTIYFQGTTRRNRYSQL